MTVRGKHGKPRPGFPPYPPPLEIAQNQAIPTFPTASPTIPPIKQASLTPAGKPSTRGGPNQGAEIGPHKCSRQAPRDGAKVRILMRQIVRNLREATRSKKNRG